MNECPVCGEPLEGHEFVYEDERYVGEEGAELKVSIPYCNRGSQCSAVAAANVLDSLAEPFCDLVGRR